MTNVALFLHLTGALLFVAGIVVAGVGFEAARRRERPAEIALLLSLARSGVKLVAVGGLLLLGCGLWLVGLEDAGFDSSWVDSALALFVLALLLGGFGGRRPKKARVLATRLGQEEKAATPELRALLDDAASRAANYLSALLVVAILSLMVFKP